jgi:hypothetical protein
MMIIVIAHLLRKTFSNREEGRDIVPHPENSGACVR